MLDIEQTKYAILGAVVGYIIQLDHEYIGQLRAPTGLFDEWHSSWQPTGILDCSWVTEKLVIKRTILGIRLVNECNTGGYEWEAKAKLIQNKYLIGEWKSTKPGSTAEGIFALVFSIDGSYLSGVFIGPDSGRGKIASGFVLGRTYKDMDRARKCLELMGIDKICKGSLNDILVNSLQK
jgi:hypothetical protein